jgi:recombinational DNA repair protein (RecF pathway)
MNELTRRAFLSSCGAALAFSDCARTAATGSSYQVLRADGEPLRSAFNRAAGGVRIVALVSPT